MHVDLPAERDFPAGAMLRRQRHLISEAHRPERASTSRRRLTALAAALALAGILSIPALGVVGTVKSWLAGGHGPDFPVPTAPDVVIASGKTGVAWRLIATPSNQGLCLFLVSHVNGQVAGGGGCGYVDIRGDLPPDVRGDPAQKCIATPTALAPCGSLPRHWVDVGRGGSSAAGFTESLVFGLLAQQVASIELVLTSGETVRGHVVRRPEALGAPLNVYWAAWPCGSVQPAGGGLQECREGAGPEVRMAIARDSAGRVLERRAPSWNGNPSGDPTGPPPPVKTG